MIYTDYAIARLRAFLNQTGVAKSRLAINAEVAEGSVRDVHDPEWNPTAETLRRLEKAIPEEFVPEINGNGHSKKQRSRK